MQYAPKAPKDKTPKRDFSCAETASLMSSFQTLRIRLYVSRTGFSLQFDSGDRIETINPTSGRGVDSLGK